MHTVSVSELKAHLSKYLRLVRRGGEVQILDRGVPVARLTALAPTPAGQDDPRRDELVRSGTLRAGTADVAAVLDTVPLELPTTISDALADDRDDRL